MVYFDMRYIFVSYLLHVIANCINNYSNTHITYIYVYREMGVHVPGFLLYDPPTKKDSSTGATTTTIGSTTTHPPRVGRTIEF